MKWSNKTPYNVKTSLAELIKGAFKDIYDIIADDEKLLEFFAPQLKEFEKVVETVEQRSELITHSETKLLAIRKKLDGLMVEPVRIEG